MSVATQWGDVFDSDLKRFRYVSSLIYASLLSCEFAAPFAPGSFLLLASISNVGRAVSRVPGVWEGWGWGADAVWGATEERGSMGGGAPIKAMHHRSARRC